MDTKRLSQHKNNKLGRYFVKSYDDSSFIIQEKAVSLMYFNIIFCAVVPLITVINVVTKGYMGSLSIFLFSMAINQIIPIIDLILLKKGKYTQAGNFISISLALLMIVFIFSSVSVENPFEVYTGPSYFLFVMIVIAALFSTRLVLTFVSSIIVISNITFFIIVSDKLNTGFTELTKIAATNSSISMVVVCCVCLLIVTISDEAFLIASGESKKSKKQYRDIANILDSVQDTSIQLASSSSELSTTSEAFAGNSQNQAASAEEMTATIEEISAGIENIADNVAFQNESMESLIEKMQEFSGIIKEVRNSIVEMLKLSEGITEYATSGDRNLKQMNESIDTISNSSGEMNNIIKIINDISDKINLLSLNAAIEAARAGDAGRGFAVVADEISKLADKTAESANDISNLISSNDKEINGGKENVTDTVETIKKILVGVNCIYEKMDNINEQMNLQLNANSIINKEAENVKTKSDEIKTASEEQKIASTEIVKSISQINDLSQSNASGSIEISGSSQGILEMSEKLKELVSSYQKN